MTIATDNAQRFAVNDRRQRADQVLTAACRDAVGIFRLGRRHGDKWASRDAEHLLTCAVGSADRILGPRPQTAPASTSTPEAGARPDAHAEGEAAGRPVTTSGGGPG